MLNKIIPLTLFSLISAQSLAASPPNPMQTWILMGDSIMSAVSPSKVNGPSGTSKELTANLLMNEKNISIRNISSPGNSLGHRNYTGFGDTSSVNESIDRIGGAFSFYNGIIIQAGTNDFGRDVPPENVVETLRNILAHAKKNNKKVLIMEPIWRRNELVKNKLGFDLNTYRFYTYVVCMNEYPTICHYASRSSSKLANASASKFYDSNEVKDKGELHLNAAGHRAYADWIKVEAAKKKWF